MPRTKTPVRPPSSQAPDPKPSPTDTPYAPGAQLVLQTELVAGPSAAELTSLLDHETGTVLSPDQATCTFRALFRRHQGAADAAQTAQTKEAEKAEQAQGPAEAYPVSVRLTLEEILPPYLQDGCFALKGTYTLAEDIAIYHPWHGYFYAHYYPADQTGEIILTGPA